MSIALSGCVIIKKKNNNIRYRRKCEKCGDTSVPYTTTSAKGKQREKCHFDAASVEVCRKQSFKGRDMA